MGRGPGHIGKRIIAELEEHPEQLVLQLTSALHGGEPMTRSSPEYLAVRQSLRTMEGKGLVKTTKRPGDGLLVVTLSEDAPVNVSPLGRKLVALAHATMLDARLEPTAPYPGDADTDWPVKCMDCETEYTTTLRTVRKGEDGHECALPTLWGITDTESTLRTESPQNA